MTFKEKIDKILELNELGVNSVSALEDKVGAGRGAINEFYNLNREPGRKTLKKIKSFPGLNSEWYDTNNGDVFLKKGTYVEIPMEESTKSLFKEATPDQVLRNLIDGDSKYLIINRELILEKYRLQSIEDIEKQNKEFDRRIDEMNKKHELTLKELEDRKDQIHGLYKIISEIASKIPDSTKLPAIQKTQ